MTGDVIVQIVVALGGAAGVGALVDRFVLRRARRMQAEAEAENAEIDGAKRITEIALQSLIGPLEDRIRSLTTTVSETEARYRSLTAYVEVLVSTLRHHQVPVPPWPEDVR